MSKMLIKKITFPTSLKHINDISDSNVDVFVELENGAQYTLIVATPKNFLTLMDRHGTDFLEPGLFVIVRKLTVEIIEKTVHAHTQDDGYWLKLHHFSESIKNDMFDKLQEEEDKMYTALDID